MDASIERANDIKNAIEVKYVDASRNKLLIKNADMEMVYDLQADRNKMASILSNTMDVVLEDNGGHRYSTGHH